jgi:hypothetical protein
MRPNAKHERFAQFLADGLPQHKAYLKAGFKAAEPRSAASKLLQRNGSIKQRVDAILAEREKIKATGIAKAIEQTTMDKVWVLTKLGKVVDMGMAARPVLNTKGEPTGEYQTNLGATNRALELIGKEQGMFIDRREVKLDQVQALTDEELDQRIRDSAARAGVALSPKRRR